MSQGVRRSGRIAKEVPILLIGSDTEGRVFSEETKTVVLSRHGAGIVSRHKLAAEDEIIIRSRESNKEAIAHVVGQIGFDNGVYSYGIAFADPNIHFWNTLLAPPMPSEMVALRLAFECNACGQRTILENAEEAADVHAINDGIVRFCQVCGFSTVWKISSGPLPASAPTPPPSLPSIERTRLVHTSPSRPPLVSPPSPEKTSTPSAYSSAAIALDDLPSPYKVVAPSAPAPPAAAIPAPSAPSVPSVPSGPPANRRKYVRARVTVAACVRTPDFGDDIAICEDISRGGVRFKSRKHYPIGANIEVAVPYSPETQSIFVHGRIVFVQDLPDQSLTRHGVCYLPASGDSTMGCH